METKKKLSGIEKFAYGIGAVGKDMVYMLSASYILYYYQDIMGVSAWAMGVILLVARVFDAFNDPIMGVIVAKTKTRWGKFRPWLLIGTLTNAVILYLMFSAPTSLNAGGLVAYAAVTYILWGVTYTMMDIPYWSMVPAFTESGKERENLSALARSCAGVGSAVITIITVMCVSGLGKWLGGANDGEVERLGFQAFAAIVAVLFVIFTVITCVCIKEKSSVDMQTASVKDMFRALIQNDQAMTMVAAIVLINSALYITSNLLIYFFKYDFSGAGWKADYTLFNTFGGAFQILAMMILFPLLRKFMSTIKVFYVSFTMAFCGYLILLFLTTGGVTNVYFLLVPAFLIMSAIGMLNVIVTVFLANTVDYGELKNKRRDESVIFSMQTFVVKLASGISALVASLVLTVCQISSDETVEATVSGSSRIGLRMSMTIIPIFVLIIAVIIFRRHYILTDEKLNEIKKELEKN
ncbi:sugar:sodium symporter [Roseburia sp. MUC/MUC-530-WT-4D]|uniref:Sugar:sodium symporter n=1 Tax=Roseburia porci TaxID=2605790 RepID=A0A6L5YSF3_9FIRM|nr:glycoside-pentoside-hexuronide (GPH):cation symporter [Roseburia porci]MDD6742936.1 glycoside-pentoside-hexuronide (GPH):cation symporter [Roseburia porci]MST74621.1 sugar:sodium symporter [Roseburia porci]